MKKKEEKNMFAVLLLAAFFMLPFSVGVHAQSKAVKLSSTNLTLQSVFRQIEQQTDYSVDYDAAVIKTNKSVRLPNAAGTVASILSEVLASAGYTYEMRGSHIIVYEQKNQKDSNARISKKVKGVVKGADGEPLIGVSVTLKDKKAVGAITDIDGKYEIDAPAGTILTFSYIGYVPQDIKVGHSSVLDVRLSEDSSNALNEVVVVGYGTMKKSDLTGTTAQIKPAAITSGVNSNVMESLQGKAAGVAVFNNNQPGSSPSIRVRGSGSISASNEPLYVIDGLPLMDGDISDINPADIESMEILKDASSTAIYGSRGANGVVMITTRQGKEGTKNMTFNSSFGVQMPGRLMNLINGEDFIRFINDAYVNQGSSAPFTSATGVYAGTNWEKEILKSSSLLQNYNLSFSGQTGDTQYMISGGYYKQDGLIPTQSYEKFSFHTNLRHRFNKWLTVGANLQYTYAIRNDQNNALGNVPRYGWPTDSPTDENGRYAVPDNPYVTDAWNPLQDFDNETHRTTTNRVLFNTFAEMKLLEHLTYRLSIGQDIKNGRGYEFYTSQTVANQSKNASGNGSHSWYKNFSKVMENVLTYSNQWDKHRFTATGVYSWQDFVYENLGISASGFGMDVTGAWDIEQADRSSLNPNSTKYGNKLISFTGRITYAYDDKYLLTATSRWDGSSRFGTNNKWGYFPSVGLAWRATQEKFLSDNKVLTDLKLRASFGITGNQEIGNYKSLPQLLAANYTDGINEIPGYYESIGNDDLKWERTSQWNFGFDLGLFNRVSLNFDYYIRKTKDLLYDVPIPSTSGYSTILSNVGEVGNRGWELAVGANVFKNKDWSIDASVNATYNKNEVRKLYGNVEKVTLSDQSMGLSRRLVVGQPVDGVYAFHSLGIIKTQEQLEAYKAAVPSVASTAKLGDEMYEDISGDGTLSSEDYVCIGSIQPKYFYGLNLNVSYRQLSLSVYGQGGFKYASIAGADNNSTSGTAWALGYSNLGSYLLYGENQVTNLIYIPTEYAYDRMWSTANPDGDYPAAGAHNIYLSDRTNGDWNYFVLKNIQLTYDLTSLLNIRTVKSLSASLNFQNFVTFANHRGYNPINGDISNPWAKSVILGVNVKF